MIKNILRAAAVAFCVLISQLSNAQSPYQPFFDTAIRDIRTNGFPEAHYSVDDYIQYAPAVALLGMKAFGYDSRSSWGRMLTADAFSVAIMAGLVNGVKYSVKRMRPDGSSRNSFPSGHTATSFMLAAMLHKEYGWRSPWFSFGAYAIASMTGISRLVNDRHWATDVVAGALIGTAAVSLGYLISDAIFKDRHLNKDFSLPDLSLDPAHRYHVLRLNMGHRFIPGRQYRLMQDGQSERIRGGGAVGLAADFPIVPCFGVSVSTTAGSLSSRTLSTNLYDIMAGGYWTLPFAKILTADARLMAGYSIAQRNEVALQSGICSGFTMGAEAGLGILCAENFSLNLFTGVGMQRFTRTQPFLPVISLGGSARFFW